METKQETKSLPRNRKCGNCRYFEPAPLWRKGWCRNPRLYDRRANHLVDASSIDCEQVFRARIYWEPVPTPEPIEAEAKLIGGYQDNRSGENFTEPLSADGGGRNYSRNDGVLRPSINRPVSNRREKAAATPNIVAKSSEIRKWLMENIPYYERIDAPMGRINFKMWLPWLIVLILVIFVLFNVTGGKNKNNTDVTPVANVTASGVSPSGSLPPAITKASTDPVTTAANGSPKATATLSTALPTATTSPPTPTKQAKTLAKVIGTQTKGVRMRKDPHVSAANEPSNVVVTVPEGQEVEITGPFKTAEGINWWPVTYKNQAGWIAQEYLQKKE
ncbi:MAG: SH3 domain-containing protein [Chloroflexi bacterium]|nr:SH3 domain-containing protein [Chloroflexota bacterium]